MNLAIIGTGKMAQQLGLGWSRVGHHIAFGSRTPDEHQWLADQVKGISVVDPAAAIESARTVVLCLPYHAMASFAHSQAAALRQRLVIDPSNPLDLAPTNGLAGAEVTANAIGPGARVVAAFKGNFAATLLEPVELATELVRDVHYAGDNPDDKQIVALLIEDLGFRPVDCGPLKNARVLDNMVPLLLELDRRYGGQHKSAWKFVG
jgi:predicted dinucleotide-binding enzyme